jgi:hypothetical protein
MLCSAHVCCDSRASCRINDDLEVQSLYVPSMGKVERQVEDTMALPDGWLVGWLIGRSIAPSLVLLVVA